MPFPEQRDLMEELVAEHKELKDQPLVLALYYASKVYPNDECLFEVADNFGFNVVDPDKNLMQVAFGASRDMPLPNDSRFVLLLTSPAEGEVAIRENWDEIQDVQQAIRAGTFEVLYRDSAYSSAETILSLLQGQPVAV